MSSKNWNDRADKDLFFTILSVKNIGIVSGGEWTTIGNHMRSMGYGFTNEGCRQHFQGLRRAQNKAEANGSVVGNGRYSDPTLNPITRRPGPGRGRPKKKQTAPEGEDGQSGVDGSSQLSTPGTIQSGPTPEQQVQQQVQQLDQQLDQQQYQQQSQQLGQQLGQQQGQQQAQEEAQEEAKLERAVSPSHAPPIHIAVACADAIDAASIKVDEAEDEAEDADGAGDEEPPIKRQRMDDTQEAELPAALDDEAVLALAAHNGASGSDYQEDFGYGDA